MTPSPAPLSDAEHDAFVTSQPAGHVLQSTHWSALKTAHGWTAARSATRNSTGQVDSAASLLLRAFPYGLGRIAYCPRGPVTNWDTPYAGDQALSAAATAARRAGAFALVIEPELADSARANALLARNGFCALKFAVQPRRSIVLDVHGDDEQEILARMKQKTRYNIGLARRKGVTVRLGGEADAPMLHAMMQTTAARDRFSIHPQDYYRDFLRLFCASEGGPGALFIAEHAGQPLAALVATALGETGIYLYGASDNEKRELMPTYLLQFEAMRWARARGCARYDLWGVPDEDEATLEAQFEARHDGLWGVYRFKRGFGGQLTRTCGAWARVLSPLRWRLYRIASKRRGGHGLAA